MDSVKVSKGILLMRSKSGTSKIEKVLVHAKRSKRKKNVVKCKLDRFEGKADRKDVQMQAFLHIAKNNKETMTKDLESESFVGDESFLRSSHFEIVTQVLCNVAPSQVSVSSKQEESNGKGLPHKRQKSDEIVTSAIFNNYDFKEESNSCEDTAESIIDTILEKFELVITNQNKEEAVVEPLIRAMKMPTLFNIPESEVGLEKSELESSESSSESHQKYITSGLRRLRSDESRLVLKKNTPYHHHKQKNPQNDEPKIKPLLSKISSSMFQTKHKKIRANEQEIINPVMAPKPTPISSSETGTSSQKSSSSEPNEALQKLKNYDDVTFTIKMEKLTASLESVPEGTLSETGEESEKKASFSKKEFEEEQANKSEESDGLGSKENSVTLQRLDSFPVKNVEKVDNELGKQENSDISQSLDSFPKKKSEEEKGKASKEDAENELENGENADTIKHLALKKMKETESLENAEKVSRKQLDKSYILSKEKPQKTATKKKCHCKKTLNFQNKKSKGKMLKEKTKIKYDYCFHVFGPSESETEDSSKTVKQHDKLKDEKPNDAKQKKKCGCKKKIEEHKTVAINTELKKKASKSQQTSKVEKKCSDKGVQFIKCDKAGAKTKKKCDCLQKDAPFIRRKIGEFSRKISGLLSQQEE